MILEKVLVDPLRKVGRLAREALQEVDLVAHVRDLRGLVDAQVEVRVEQVRREEPLHLGLVDLRRRHRVVRVGLERAVELREEPPPAVEEEDVVVHQQGVLGAHARQRLQPRVEWVREGADRQELEPIERRVVVGIGVAAQALLIGGALLPWRQRVRVQHTHALRQRAREVLELHGRRRERVLGADEDRHVFRKDVVSNVLVVRGHHAWHRRRERVPRESLRGVKGRRGNGRQLSPYRRTRGHGYDIGPMAWDMGVWILARNTCPNSEFCRFHRAVHAQ